MNEALAQLYQSIILDHQANPRNQGPLPNATHEARQDNPFCGDRVTLRLIVAGTTITELRYEAEGCAISIASASLLTTHMTGKTIAEALALDSALRIRLRPVPASVPSPMPYSDPAPPLPADLDSLTGTRLFPSRIACATLPWDALLAALRLQRGASE